MPDEIEIGGVLPEIPDERDWLAGDVSDFLDTPLSALPESIRFNPLSADLASQGKTVQCTAHSATNALEATYFVVTGVAVRIDAADQWRYQTEVFPKTANQHGDQLASAMRAIKHRSDAEGGVPAVESNSGRKIRIRVAGYAKIPLNFDDFCRAQNAGHAVVVSAKVLRPKAGGKSNFALARDTGWLSFPQDWADTGGHAFCHLIGYDRKERYGVIGQSYGEGYGFWGNGTLRIRPEEIARLNPSAYVIFIDDKAGKRREIMMQIAMCKRVWLTADKYLKQNPEIAREVASIQRDAHAARVKLSALL